LKYDGEPFEPQEVAQQVQAILAGRPRPLDVTPADAREIAYHYIRTHLDEDVRPGRVEKDGSNAHQSRFGEWKSCIAIPTRNEVSCESY